MIVVTEAWIFNGPIQHLLAMVFVAMFIGISYLFVKKVQDLEIQLVVLKEKNSVLKTESENLKRKVELLEISYKQFVDRSEENKIEDAKQDTPKVAFYANTVTDHVNLGVHRTLVFGNVITNIGNCYHNSTGSFVPKVSGIYIVNVQILCSPGYEFRTELVVEGAVKGTHYIGDSTHYSNGGGMAVVHVDAGDCVWVRVATTDGENDIAWESSFSGFLLYSDS